MSINFKFNILNGAVLVFFLLSLMTSYELSKGAQMQQLNFNHIKYNNMFLENVKAYKEGRLKNLEILRQDILLVREQPIACLKSINIIEELFMSIIKTEEAITLCTKDIEDTNKVLRTLGEYENDKISKEMFLEDLHNAVNNFNKNSDDFDPLMTKTVSALFRFLITVGIIFGGLVFILAGLITKAIKNDYSKMTDMSEQIQKLASFPAKNPHPVLEINRKMEVTYANPAFKNTFPNLPLDERFKDEIFKKSLTFAKKTFKEKTAFSFDHKLDDRWFNFYLSYVKIAGEELIRIFIRNITLQKNTQERFELATKGAHIGLWDWNTVTNKTHFSDEWYTLLGYEPLELPEDFETFRQLCHPDDFKEAMALLEQHLAGEIDGYTYSVRMKHKQGHQVWILTTGQVTEYNDNGEPVRVSGIHLNITDRKKAEQDLIDANIELEEFAYRTSHDLRSPIISSTALLDVINDMLSKGNIEDAKSGIEHAKSSLNKLKSLIDDILQLTMIKRKKEDKKEVSILEIIEESLKKLSHMDGYKKLEIQKSLKFKNPLIIQKLHLTMILENMLSNAIKYQDPEKKKPFIRISTAKNKNKFILKITDNGLGIPEEQQENLFQMFKRFHPKVAFGSGLGLYLMKKSADALGGELEFNDPGDGSTFTLKIPLEQSDDS